MKFHLNLNNLVMKNVIFWHLRIGVDNFYIKMLLNFT